MYQNYTTQLTSQDLEQFNKFESMMLGVPYKERSFCESAVDCWGLVILFYKICLKVNVNNYFSYEDGQDFSSCYEDEVQQWKETTSPAKGDVIVAYVGSRPVHVGLWWGHDKILHARERTFVRIDRIRTIERLSTKLRFFKYAIN